MKKFLLFVVATMLLGTASAQDWQKHILGVRGGVNFSKVDVELFDFDMRTSGHIGVSYEYKLLKDNPLYLETGLYLIDKGCKFNTPDYYDGDDEYYYSDDYYYEDDYYEIEGDIKASMLYLQVPVMLNYKFNLQDVMTIYPSAGFYYAYGIAGKIKSDDGDIDAFGSDGLADRSDFGLRLGVSAIWKKFVFGVSYEAGLTNILEGEADEVFSFEGKHKSIYISVGYNF